MAARRNTKVGVGDLLPHEIWTEILTRLSVKMVLRCRSVCKSWYSLTSCPNFISGHSNRNLNKNENRVLLRVRDVDGWSHRSLDESSMESRVHDYIPDSSCLEIVGSCNGLICLSNTRDGMISSPSSSYESRPRITFIIWNPSIRKIIKVSSRPFRPRTQRLSYFGFGFDSKTNDYRVLCVVGNRKNGDISDAMCEIFDLRTGVWRVICPQSPSSWSIRGGNIPECYLDGAVHWSNRRVLLSFSLSDESFREIKMPKYAKQSGPYPIRSVTFSGLIYVIMWTGLANENCSVWAMKEYGVRESWTRLFDINLQSFGGFHIHTICKSPRLFRLWKNGEVLLVQAHLDGNRDRDMYIEGKHELVSYNPETGNFESLLSFKTISDLCLYEERLVLM